MIAWLQFKYIFVLLALKSNVSHRSYCRVNDNTKYVVNISCYRFASPQAGLAFIRIYYSTHWSKVYLNTCKSWCLLLQEICRNDADFEHIHIFKQVAWKALSSCTKYVHVCRLRSVSRFGIVLRSARLQYGSRGYYVKTPWNGNVALVIVLIINIACSRCALLMWEVQKSVK